MIDSDVANRLYTEIVNGVAKADSSTTLNQELSEFWDVVAQQVAEGNKRGVVWDIPNEMPNVNQVTSKKLAPGKGAEADLTKAARNAIHRALMKLNRIPMVDDKHIAVPWPITERMKLDPEMWAQSEIQSVFIADLYASQELLTKERVIFFIENPGAIELGRRAFANVYDLGERLVIVDGHHRLAALWLLGADVANVWFLEE
jgi:hypothetical protein